MISLLVICRVQQTKNYLFIHLMMNELNLLKSSVTVQGHSQPQKPYHFYQPHIALTSLILNSCSLHQFFTKVSVKNASWCKPLYWQRSKMTHCVIICHLATHHKRGQNLQLLLSYFDSAQEVYIIATHIQSYIHTMYISMHVCMYVCYFTPNIAIYNTTVQLSVGPYMQVFNLMYSHIHSYSCVIYSSQITVCMHNVSQQGIYSIPLNVSEYIIISISIL